jgi:hypothetical protein
MLTADESCLNLSVENRAGALPRPKAAYAQEDLMITEDYVRKIFKELDRGDGAGFFEHVDDKVDWIVEGTHPLAGQYLSISRCSLLSR